VNFKNVCDSTRVRVPFGIAQMGKSFRNEITPRNFTFRSREFEQMEIEFFCHPKSSPQWYQYWRDRRMKWYTDLGLAGERLSAKPVAAYKSDVTPEEIGLYQSKKFVGLLPTRRIDQLLDRPNMYGKMELLRVKHWRFTQPLMNVVLLLLAIPCVLTREPGTLKTAATKTLALMGIAMASVFVFHQFANSVPKNKLSSGNRVMIENQVGTPGIGETTRAKLLAAGFTYLPGQNAPGMPNATAPSVVLITGTTAADIARGNAVATALGLPTSDVRVSSEGIRVADIVVLLGADYKS